MIINNLELIKPLLNFEDPDKFYLIELIKRKKENPELNTNSKKVIAVYITSLNSLENKWLEMVNIAEAVNARIYINLNRRSFEDISKYMCQKTIELFVNKQYTKNITLFESLAGSYANENNRNFIIDVDDKITNLEDLIENVNLCEPLNDSKLKVILPTVNGTHIVTKPFNKEAFMKIYPKTCVFSNGLAFLYYNNKQ